MSWGYRILGVYLLFVAGIVYLVIRSASQTVDLVAPNYYEQELAYQERIDDEARTAALHSALSYELKDGALLLNFPAEMRGKTVTGQVLLYCPSDKKKDMSMPVQTLDATARLEIPKDYAGHFEIQVSWKTDGKGFFAKRNLYIP